MPGRSGRRRCAVLPPPVERAAATADGRARAATRGGGRPTAAGALRGGLAVDPAHRVGRVAVAGVELAHGLLRLGLAGVVLRLVGGPLGVVHLLLAHLLDRRRPRPVGLLRRVIGPVGVPPVAHALGPDQGVDAPARSGLGPPLHLVVAAVDPLLDRRRTPRRPVGRSGRPGRRAAGGPTSMASATGVEGDGTRAPGLPARVRPASDEAGASASRSRCSCGPSHRSPSPPRYSPARLAVAAVALGAGRGADAARRHRAWRLWRSAAVSWSAVVDAPASKATHAVAEADEVARRRRRWCRRRRRARGGAAAERAGGRQAPKADGVSCKRWKPLVAELRRPLSCSTFAQLLDLRRDLGEVTGGGSGGDVRRSPPSRH